jgi:hypothetical protein
MKKLFYVLGVFLVLFLWVSCEKEDSSPNTLGGSTDIPLTPVNGVSSVFGSYGNQNINGGSITVVKNEDGLVTYKALIDLNQFSNELKLKALTYLTQLSSYYKFDTAFTLAPDGKLSFEFKLKITSEGYQDFFVEGKPWVIGKYGDGVGTEYTVTNSKGEELVRTVTEKTGIDEWPLGFFYIKTSKIEQDAPVDDPVISKVIYRINHRFGLVYLEYQLKDGTTLKLSVFAPFV